MQPRVSILMPVFNAERFLKLSIESILDQTFTDFELIVADDGSTDRSREVVETFKDTRIHPIMGQRRGLPAVLNSALAQAHGEYIARMDADDIAVRRRLELQVGFLDSHPRVGLVGTGLRTIDGSGSTRSVFQVLESDHHIRATLIRRNPFFHPTVMMRTALLRQVGGYSVEYRCSQDYDLWFRMARVGELANINQPLLYYRYHPTNLTSASQKQMLWEGTVIRWKVLRDGDYPWSAAAYLLPRLALFASPQWLLRGFRHWQWARGRTMH